MFALLLPLSAAWAQPQFIPGRSTTVGGSQAQLVPELYTLRGVTTVIHFDADIDRASVQVDLARIKLLAAAGGVLTLVLGLSLGWLARPREPQPIAAVEGSSPPPQPAPPVEAVNPPPAPPALTEAPPVPRAAQQPSPSKRGSTVKRAEEVEQSAPSVCTRKEPPPADRPALLRQWCRCAGIALAFASACTGAQLRPSSGERCPDEALEAMDKLELPRAFYIQVDENQPYVEGEGRVGYKYKEGPITGVFHKDVGKVPKGSRIFGEMIGPFPSPIDGTQTWKILYTRLQPLGGKAVPVCAVLGPDDGVITWFEGSRPGAAVGNKIDFVTTITRWPQWP